MLSEFVNAIPAAKKNTLPMIIDMEFLFDGFSRHHRTRGLVRELSHAPSLSQTEDDSEEENQNHNLFLHLMPHSLSQWELSSKKILCQTEGARRQSILPDGHRPHD